MIAIGKRLRQLREARGLAQSDIELKTGLLRCYVSRVECGHTVPSINTLEKLATALDIPLWEVFVDIEIPSESPRASHLTPEERKFTDLLKKASKRDRRLFLSMADKLARQGGNVDRQGPARQIKR